ncbi:MAG: VOC family protein [Pseudomonadota bacterium]
MIWELDHLVISCTDLAEGAAQIEAALGVPLTPGGQHAAFGTHNRLLSLGPAAYLEVIAIDPSADRPDRARWYGLDAFSGAPRLTHWAARVADLDKALAGGPLAEVATPLSLVRGDYRWRMAVTDTGQLPFDDVYPALLEWQGPHPAAALPDRGVRLTELVLHHPEGAALGRLLGDADRRMTVKDAPPGLSARLATPQGEVVL